MFFTFSLFAQNQIGSAKIKTVCIDPGHGGRDPGAIGKSIKEKELSLALALKIGKYINARFPDVQVIYTRQEDVFIELYQRAEIANKAKADLFISIHANSTVKKEANGVEFWVLGLHKADENLEVAKKENSALQFEQNVRTNYGFDPNSPEGNIIMTMKQSLHLDKSIQFAKAIESKFTVDESQVVRGTKQAGFLVLYKTAMPGVLIEIGFISNPDEEQYMAGDFGQQKIATKIVNAFADYKRSFESGALNTNEAKAQVEAIKSAPEKKTIIVSEQTLENPNSNPVVEIEAETAKPISSFGVSTSTSSTPVSTINPPVRVQKEKESFSAKSPSSKVLTDAPVKKKIIIDEESDRADVPKNPEIIDKKAKEKDLELKTNIPKSIAEKPKEKIKFNAESTSPKDNVVKPQVAKAVIKELIVDKSIDEINQSEKRAPSDNVPYYINNADIKKEIIKNTNSIGQNIKTKIDQPAEVESTKTAVPKPVKNSTPKDGLVYRVQVKASGTKVKENDMIFSFGYEVEESPEDGMFKYLVGSFNSETEANSYKILIREKGITDAFVVKYANGKRVK